MSTTKLKIGIVGALLLGAVAALLVQHQANLGLERENARLAGENRELGRLRQENQRLKQEATASTPAQANSGPGTAVNRGNAAARATDGTFPLAAGLIPIRSLKNAGRATPGAAFQTQLWAARNGDIALTASAITFGPEARAKMEALVAALPESAQKTYNTPEKLMAFVLAGSPHPVGGMQILGEDDVDPNTVILHTQWQHEDDSVVHTTNARLQNSGDGWQVVIPLILVDGARNYLLRNSPE